MFTRIWLILILWLTPLWMMAQTDSVVSIKGIPTRQVYDLMTDSRGFIWIGHEMGLTRYDGITFTHFSHPRQNSLAVSNILEDPQGRIWCRNFTSQVYYVENEQMQLLDSYPYKEEPRFPQMIMLEGHLVCTTVKGLFDLDTRTFNSRYISCEGMPVTSINLWKGKIVAYSSPVLFLVDPLLSPATVNRLQFPYDIGLSQGITLQGISNKDTLYSFSPKTGDITKYLIEGRRVKIVERRHCDGLFNSINYSGKEWWLHTSNVSYTLDGTNWIRGEHNLTDIVVDKEGNTWISSLSEGIMVKYQNYWQEVIIPFLEPGERLVKMDVRNHIAVYATSRMKIIIRQELTGQIINSFTLSAEDKGPVQVVRFIDDDKIVIATSLRLYLVNPTEKKFRKLYSDYTFLSVKDAELLDTTVYLAAATGFYKVIHQPDTLGNDFTCTQLSAMRSRCVVFDPGSGKLLIAFKDGLSHYEASGFKPVLFNHKDTILATALYRFQNKVYIADFRGDIYVKEGERIQKLTSPDGGRGTAVISIQNFRDTLWMLSSNYLRAVNPKTDRLITNLYIPSFTDAGVLDIGYLKEKLVILTAKAVFSFHTQAKGTGYQLNNSITKVLVNGMEIKPATSLKLSHDQNSIEFYLATPLFTNSVSLYYKYRLSEKGGGEWSHGETGVARFLFSSLQPGHYVFEAQAVHPQFGIAQQPVQFKFTIQKMWFDRGFFKFFLILLIGTAVLAPLIVYFRFRIRRQKILYDKQIAISLERNRISDEIHDDIGASLSGLRLQTELLERQASDLAAKENLGKIHQSMKELSESMQEVIWSLNSRQDSLENLLHFTQKQAGKLFENSGIRLETRLPENIPFISISSDKRADIYLTVKEALHNALKHSQAGNIRLDCSIRDNRLYISVSDDGRGFSRGDKKISGNGLINMRKRITRLGGKLEISGQNGTSVFVEVPL